VINGVKGNLTELLHETVDVTYLEFLLNSDRKPIAVTEQIDQTAQHWFGCERQTLAANPSLKM